MQIFFEGDRAEGIAQVIHEHKSEQLATKADLAQLQVKEPLIKCTIGRRAALCPRSTLTYLHDKLRVSLRDALPCIPLSHLIRGSSG